MPGFDDKFSEHASTYAKFRPLYPAALFEHLARLAPGRTLAWDVGTGSGQAAVGLAKHFDKVIATDASEQQVQNAIANPRVQYRTAPADSSGIEAASVDLVTAAAAVHWFDLDSFYAEVRRVLRPRGVIAVWCYREPRCGPGIDEAILRYQNDLLGKYWSPKIGLVMSEYRTLPFPFEEVAAPAFQGHARWTLDELLGYLGTWSARRDYINQAGEDPLEVVRSQLAAAWGDPTTSRDLYWPIFMRIGRVPQPQAAPEASGFNLGVVLVVVIGVAGALATWAVAPYLLGPFIFTMLAVAIAMTIFQNRRSPAPGTCARCGYDLRGLGRGAAQCPECGWPLKRT